MNKLLDSLHKKILKSKFAEEVTEAEIDALVEAKEYNGGWIPCSERLEEEKNVANNTYMNYGLNVDLGRVFGLDKAIEIVNQLAEEYNNDFCEWFKYDYRTIAPKSHDAGNPYWRIPENMDKLKHCPYCGKKIKVVE